ncbi:sialate O-acetylesterase [Bacillus sp. PS06]|uniref:sialate O-acetylesterase n=1 Tax=Bacillus sp. PS06 TaxID=2764176 RepID=UPI00177CDDB9|nr:sialate O-acetylesterase [Bacillus sp. PS06]MBD8070437.1 sialate O-acetylesterase [Bacillus sp. PS06]
MELSSIFSDGMVLQRHKEITISGKTKPFQQVNLIFLEKSYPTMSDQTGDWSVILDPLEPGGPYQMEIVAEDRQTIQDILIGDVWILGGQSNMELPTSRTLDLFYDELKAVNYPNIRQFSIPLHYDFHGPKKVLTGGSWISATNDDVMKFSAAGYFFAKELYEKYDIPIGLILTAVGGTPIEAWISEPTLRHLGGYDSELDQHKNDEYIATVKWSDETRQNRWNQYLNEKDLGLKNDGWFGETIQMGDWNDFEVPNSWEGTHLEAIRGSVWFRKEFDVPESMLGGDVKLELGTIIDADETYINGTLIGTTGYRYPPRRYSIPDGILKPGKNTITVRIISTHTTGGFVEDMPYKLIANGQEASLEGTWKYKIGAITETLEPQTFFQYKPSGVYNGMISPLRDVSIKGVLFYQGESNTAHPKGYSELFQAMVKDWRTNWGLGEIPFIFTQLANLETGDANHHWAILREEQRLSLQIPNTAMAVTIDIGEANDLHPQDKKTLGQRLALAAQGIAYNEPFVYSGPLFSHMEKIGQAIQLLFDHVGSGLIARGSMEGVLRSFTICGADSEYVPATAHISGAKIIVQNENVLEPLHVRYAWEDNPKDANLYNKEGLPASPFSTENS